VQAREQAQRVGALALGARLVELGEDGRPVEACTVEVRVRVRVRARVRVRVRARVRVRVRARVRVRVQSPG